MLFLTGRHRLEGGDAISVREERSRAAIVMIAWFLRHSIGPGKSQFTPKTVITKQYIGDAFAFCGASPCSGECRGFAQLSIDD
jgi:hypothetical protein